MNDNATCRKSCFGKKKSLLFIAFLIWTWSSCVSADEMDAISEWNAGMVLEQQSIDFLNLDQYFVTMPIPDEVWNRMYGKSYRDNYDISREDLQYLKVLHYNYDHKIQVGELVVNEEVATIFCNIFIRLFQNEYEIASMYLVDNYWTGDPDSTDTASIEVNNTSAFNYRLATNSGNLSKHALGYAIDINPQQNPYVVIYEDGSTWNYHDNANDFVNRTTGYAHMITHEDLCYQIFNEYGFTWGGDWDNPKDYQHFQWQG